MYTRFFWRLLAPLAVSCLMPLTVLAQDPAAESSVQLYKPSVVFKVKTSDDRLEMIVHTSRILTMEQKISQVQVGNSDILEVTTLSPTQVQVSAKATGKTEVNLWDENKKLFSNDILVVGDARELAAVLHSTFPNAALKVMPVASSVMISGYVDKNEHIDRIIQIAEQYYPKVINNMTVGGVQQVLLHVKVMEVSRTKLRKLGVDWAKITGANNVVSGPNGLLSDYSDTANTLPNVFRTAAPGTFAFNVSSGGSGFFAVINMLQQNNLMKIMAEPTLTAISGQTATFDSGGQIPVPTPQSLGTLSIDWKDYGTHVEFVPIVLGNGKIRLEVHPIVSELDYTNSTTISGTTVPGIKSRDVHTAAEMTAGQTLAIAGLVQTRIEAESSGLPWVSSVPYLGVLFGGKKETRNEVELLILVTPELVEPLDANEVPSCGPGMATTSPSDWELYMKGCLEVPKCPENGGACNGACPPNGGDACEPPADGMIGNPGEPVPAPKPSDAAARNSRNNRYSTAKRNSTGAASASEQQNTPPGFIGPVGYDVVK